MRVSTLLVRAAVQRFSYTQNGTQNHHQDTKACACPSGESLRP
jgi:hypothetical protein